MYVLILFFYIIVLDVSRTVRLGVSCYYIIVFIHLISRKTKQNKHSK